MKGSKPRVTRRYSLEPLAEALGVPMSSPSGGPPTLRATSLCRLLGISGSTWKEYRDHGVSELVADRLATKLGLATHTVWPEMVAHEIEDASIACRDCGESFVPNRPHQVFCEARCRSRWHGRESGRRARATPEGAERNRERRRRYYAENGAYERRREQRRRENGGREMDAVRARRYRTENADRVAQQRRARYQRNAERVRAENRAYKAANAERLRERYRVYYAANAERIRAKQAAYRARKKAEREAATEPRREAA